jgi:futalosine hydrolase
VILVVCALPQELPGFASSDRVTLLACGVGPVEAAAAAARALALRRYDAVVSAGIAGAYRGCAKVGDPCIVGEEFFADFGREDGSPPHPPAGSTLLRRVAAWPPLVELARALPYAIVRGVTSTRITTTEATALRLRQTYQAELESMESFAVFRAADIAGVPAIGVRGISNIAGDSATSEWDFQAGARATVAALRALLALLKA